MQLCIKYNQKDDKVIFNFLHSIIIPKIQLKILNNLDLKLLKRWDEYFENIYKQKEEENCISACNIIMQGILNLKIEKTNNFYSISIDPLKKFPKTFAKLYDLCSIINYGSLEFPPYPIFEDTFSAIAKEIPILFKNYNGS